MKVKEKAPGLVRVKIKKTLGQHQKYRINPSRGIDAEPGIVEIVAIARTEEMKLLDRTYDFESWGGDEDDSYLKGYWVQYQYIGGLTTILPLEEFIRHTSAY